MKCWNDFTKEETDMPRYSPSNESLRDPARYWVISDAQLARDLRLNGKGRTIEDVYRENRACRERPKDRRCYQSDLPAYQAWCKAKGHEPHPASLDAEHPIARQREGLRYVKRS